MGRWSGTLADEPSSSPHLSEQEGIQFATIDLPRAEFDAYYSGFCNGSLWPLCHYFPGRFRYNPSEYAAYQAINQRMAACVARIASSSTPVWVHNYQLMSVARYLREQAVRAPLGFSISAGSPISRSAP